MFKVTFCRVQYELTSPYIIKHVKKNIFYLHLSRLTSTILISNLLFMQSEIFQSINLNDESKMKACKVQS